MNPAVNILPHYTYAEWENWEGKWELIEGIPHAMSPSPAPRHQQIAANLSGEFHFQLKKCKQCTLYQPLDYRVADDIILQPDMLVICETITKKYLDFPPALVVEVLSPGTFLKDRHTKYSIYEAQGIPYYLIVGPDTEEIEVYMLEDDAYVLKQKGKNFDYTFRFEGCEATIDFKEIW
ncbi:MAG: Uma2 family endonuclease [Chitinophagaceae bacterium]